jgi:hypothetical protein
MSKSDFSQFTHDQLNNRVDLLEEGLRVLRTRHYDIIQSGQVCNYVTRNIRLTWRKLLKQDDWVKWQNLKYLQLDQYNMQGMFGEPVLIDKDDAAFYQVWTYGIKTLDQRKKARCVCNSSLCSGLIKVIDDIYANCVGQTSSRLFYAVTARENLLAFGADVSNAFAEAPPPKEGCYL